MKTRMLRFGCAAALALAGANLQAIDKDWYVDVNSTAAEPDGTSWETAFKDIQSAIDQVTGGASRYYSDFDKWDRIHIRPGRYLLEKTLVGGTWENSFTVCGVTDKALKYGNVPEEDQVILDGQNKVQCMTVDFARIYGITFVNGWTNVYSEGEADCYGGGGLRVGSGVGIISNCVFRNCVAGKSGEKVSKARIYGGALSMQDWQRTKYNCVYDTLFEDCGLSNGCPASVTEQYPKSAYQGGALFGPSMALSGCIFRRNFIADPTGLEKGNMNGSAVANCNAPLVDNCLFESNYFATANASAYYTMSGQNGITYSNLVFRGNSAPGRCGLTAGQGCLVTDCSFIGNRTTTKGSGVLEAPLSAANAAAAGYSTNVVQRCLFLDNYAKDGSDDNSGVCIHTHFGDSDGYNRALFVRDCAFIGNVNEIYGKACLSSWGSKRGTYAMISNCWFEANLSATNSAAAKPFVDLSPCSNFDVVDCLFKGNVSGKDGTSGSNGIIYAPGQDYADTYVATTNSSIRNCAFVGNRASLVLAVQSPVTDETVPGLTIENCTIAGNELMSQHAIQNLGNSAYRTFVYNTAIYNNTRINDSYPYYLNLYPPKWKDHVFTSYIGPQYYARTDLDQNGNIVSDADPEFVDAAGGDYRLAGSSPLRNAGQMRPWIDTERRRRKACQADLSNMRPVYDATGATPGCTVERTERCRRLADGTPDIGAYEYNPEQGLMVIFQ